MNEAINGNWSTRQLERQINSLFYERTLMSKDKKGMIELTFRTKSAKNGKMKRCLVK